MHQGGDAVKVILKKSNQNGRRGKRFLGYRWVQGMVSKLILGFLFLNAFQTPRNVVLVKQGKERR